MNSLSLLLIFIGAVFMIYIARKFTRAPIAQVEVAPDRALEIYSPRAVEVAPDRAFEVYTPRKFEVYNDKAFEVYIPRSLEVYTPKGFEVYTPRGFEIFTPRGIRFASLKSLRNFKAALVLGALLLVWGLRALTIGPIAGLMSKGLLM